MVAESHGPLCSQGSLNVSTQNPMSMTKLIHPITFIDKLIKKNERGYSFSLMDHEREILRLAFDFDPDGRLPWDTILYSCGQEVREDDDQCGSDPCLGADAGGTERDPHSYQRIASLAEPSLTVR